MSAERMRRRRARLAQGLVHIEFWADEANVTAKLTDAGKLHPNLADDPKAISEAVRKVVEGLSVVNVEPK